MLRNPALIAFALAFLLSMFFRSFFGVIGPEISSALSLSRAQFGWLSAAYFAAFALFQLPVGLLFDRFGVRWPTTVLMGVGVAGSALLAISQTSAMAIWGQIGLGIGCAPIFMGLLYHAGRILQAPDAGRAAASVSALGSIGALVSASPLAWFVTVAGWRVAVGASSVALALSAAAVATLVRDGSRQQSKMEWSSGRGWLIGVAYLMPACFTLSFGGTFRNAWASPYLTDTYGLQSISRGNALTAISVVGIVTAFAIPAMLKYVPARYVIAGFLLVGVVVSGALSILPDPGVGRSVGVIAALYAIGNIHPLVMTEAQAAIPEGRRGIGLGILNSLVFLGVSASSALFGQIMEMNNDTLSAYAWIFAATAVAVALAFLIYVMRTGFR